LLLQQLSKLAARYMGADEREDWLGTRGDILGLLREGAAGGVITEEQTQIVERVPNLSRVHLRSIMIPRRRVLAVPIVAWI
jgi:CBS domain containing-hemolysin-like protein